MFDTILFADVHDLRRFASCVAHLLLLAIFAERLALCKQPRLDCLASRLAFA